MTTETGSSPGVPDYNRIQIVPDQDMEEWWNLTKEKKFTLAHCSGCNHKWFPPFPACSKCGSMKIDFVEIQGKGEIYTYDVNTNTNYNSQAEKSSEIKGMRSIAAFLKKELLLLSNIKVVA